MSPIDSSAIILTSAKDLSSAPIQLNIVAMDCALHSTISAIFGIPNCLLEVLVEEPLVLLFSASSSFDITAMS